MSLTATLLKLLGLTQALQALKASFDELESVKREKIAAYAEAVAATFARAAAAFAILEKQPDHASARRDATREIGRIAGYIEDIVETLGVHLDGRRRSGLTRRLADLATTDLAALARSASSRRKPPIDRLLEAEGYFRALADGLRA
jgi:acyl-CoA reductase-like NAD-dependent aldehyde dehydrogenase